MDFGHYGKRPSLEFIKKMHGLYLCGMSLAKVGKRFGISRQWVHHYFKENNLPTRPRKLREKIYVNGLAYTFNPKKYWRCTSGDRHILHVKIWEDTTGTKVPPNHELMFRDGNKNNFDFSNLVLMEGRGSVSRIVKNKKAV